ncbi:MAG: gliding motility lipoprotein GldD [Dysgonamonadaceae bacterium]|jgi:gliding motility-associated lipoprotein GldD|nr:gliding motility lipoprotein GldD [Dysgonamonadaceae bacterium]
MKLLPLLFVVACLLSCNNYAPKPSGYFRIEPGPHSYQHCRRRHFSFECADKATLIPLPNEGRGEWFNISYPQFQANIHCSYLPIKPETFVAAAEDSRKFAYRHTIKADNIVSRYFENPDKKVYGILYEIEGNVASPLQFTLTDSTRHFFRGAVYFNLAPKQDSIAPVLNFIRDDVVRLMESFVFY